MTMHVIYQARCIDCEWQAEHEDKRQLYQMIEAHLAEDYHEREPYLNHVVEIRTLAKAKLPLAMSGGIG